MSNPHLFPAPPPTSNALTSEQKTKLVRSATKLSKVLGAPPQVVRVEADSSTIGRSSRHSHGPRTSSERYDPESYPLSSSAGPSPRRPSCSSQRSLPLREAVDPSPALPPYVASSGSTATIHPNSTSDNFATRSRHGHSHTSSGQSITVIPGPQRCDTPSTSSSLSLTSTSTTGSIIIVSSSHNHPDAYVSHSARTRSPIIVDDKEVSSLYHHHRHPSRHHHDGNVNDGSDDELKHAKAANPDSTSFRRAKMERVTKRLGHGVPIDLVFPPAPDSCPSPDGGDIQILRSSQPHPGHLRRISSGSGSFRSTSSFDGHSNSHSPSSPSSTWSSSRVSSSPLSEVDETVYDSRWR